MCREASDAVAEVMAGRRAGSRLQVSQQRPTAEEPAHGAATSRTGRSFGISAELERGVSIPGRRCVARQCPSLLVFVGEGAEIVVLQSHRVTGCCPLLSPPWDISPLVPAAWRAELNRVRR